MYTEDQAAQNDGKLSDPIYFQVPVSNGFIIQPSLVSQLHWWLCLINSSIRKESLFKSAAVMEKKIRGGFFWKEEAKKLYRVQKVEDVFCNHPTNFRIWRISKLQLVFVGASNIVFVALKKMHQLEHLEPSKLRLVNQVWIQASAFHSRHLGIGG